MTGDAMNGIPCLCCGREMLTETEIVTVDDECAATHLIARCIAEPDECKVSGWQQIIPFRDRRPRTWRENVALLMEVTGVQNG
jgi:hypothetical protein